jgi:hypothetical protein
MLFSSSIAVGLIQYFKDRVASYCRWIYPTVAGLSKEKGFSRIVL